MEELNKGFALNCNSRHLHDTFPVPRNQALRVANRIKGMEENLEKTFCMHGKRSALGHNEFLYHSLFQFLPFLNFVHLCTTHLRRCETP